MPSPRGHPVPHSSRSSGRRQAIKARIQLRPVPASASIARRFIGTTLDSWGCSSLVDTATLLVSEVVTNAVLHARSDLELNVLSGGHFIRVEVSDASVVTPVVRQHSTEAMTGRGLALVEMLSTAWGVIEHADGKVVWFEIAA